MPYIGLVKFFIESINHAQGSEDDDTRTLILLSLYHCLVCGILVYGGIYLLFH